ncbi:MAG: hypothetical protein ACJZ7Z_00640, partial [Myxococcota bacterium]
MLITQSVAHAEVRTLEVVGAVAVKDKGTSRNTPKDQAVQQGLRNGVMRVGSDLLFENRMLKRAQSQSNDPTALPDLLAGTALAWETPVMPYDSAQNVDMESVRKALGSNMVPYTKSFRIIDDQGERPAIFTQTLDSANEYVVVIEVDVEADSVRKKLEEKGLIEVQKRLRREGITLDLQGLVDYRLYSAMIDLLKGPTIQAATVIPEAFAQRRAELRVEGTWSASELETLIYSGVPSNLSLVTLEVNDGEAASPLWPWETSSGPKLSLRVGWAPPVEEEMEVLSIDPAGILEGDTPSDP